MAATNGMNHLGLAVKDLTASTRFFVDYLGWKQAGYDPSYPRCGVTDGVVRLTLWQVEDSQSAIAFDRRANIGLHHLALAINSEEELMTLAASLAAKADVTIEFMPEPVGDGPRKHMMCYESGGIRIEFMWDPG